MVIYVTIVICIWNIIRKLQFYNENKTQYMENSVHDFSQYVINAQSCDNDHIYTLFFKKC